MAQEDGRPIIIQIYGVLPVPLMEQHGECGVQQVAGPAMGSFIGDIDFSGHFYNNMGAGLIELGDVVYFVSITALTIFLGSVVVEMRRWR